MLCRGVARRTQQRFPLGANGVRAASSAVLLRRSFCAAAASPTNKYAVKTFNAISAKVRRHRPQPDAVGALLESSTAQLA